MTAQELETAFVCGYNKKPETIYFAIGSVSLVGEYYNCNLYDTSQPYESFKKYQFITISLFYISFL